MEPTYFEHNLMKELQKRVTVLEEALRDIAEDDCGCCDCAQRAREALGGIKGGGL